MCAATVVTWLSVEGVGVCSNCGNMAECREAECGGRVCVCSNCGNMAECGG